MVLMAVGGGIGRRRRMPNQKRLHALAPRGIERAVDEGMQLVIADRRRGCGR